MELKDAPQPQKYPRAKASLAMAKKRATLKHKARKERPGNCVPSLPFDSSGFLPYNDFHRYSREGGIA
jgi:hypothetical protein